MLSLRRTIGSSLLRNSSLLMVSTALTSALGYGYWVIAARGYDTQVVGLGTGLIAAQSLTAVACCLGANAYMIHILPKAADDDAWSTMVTAAVTFGALVSAGVATGVAFLLPAVAAHYSSLSSPGLMALFVVGSALATAGTITDGVFVSARQSGRMLTRNLVFCLVKLPIMAAPLLFVDRPTVFTILLSWVLATAVSLLLAYGYQMRKVRGGYRPRLTPGIGRLLLAWRQLAGHFFTGVGAQLPQFLLPIIVVAEVSTRANAYFYLTWSVGSIFLFVSPAVSQSLYAEGSNFENLGLSAARSLRFTGALLLPIIAASFLFAHPVLLLFGGEYAHHGSLLLQIIAISAIPDALTNVYIAVARVRGRLKRAAVLNLMMAVIAVTLTAVLVPSLGIVGAGLAWLIAQSVGAVFVVRPLLELRPHRRRTGGVARESVDQRQGTAACPASRVVAEPDTGDAW